MFNRLSDVKFYNVAYFIKMYNTQENTKKTRVGNWYIDIRHQTIVSFYKSVGRL